MQPSVLTAFRYSILVFCLVCGNWRQLLGVERELSQAWLGSCGCLSHFLIGVQTSGFAYFFPFAHLVLERERAGYCLSICLSVHAH